MSGQSQAALSGLLPYMKTYRWRIALVFCLVITVVIIDLAQPYLVKEAIDRHVAVANPDAKAIMWMAAVYLGLVLLSFGLTYCQDILMQSAGQSIVRAIRIDLFKHIQRLSLRFFDQNAAGRIITNVVNDTEALNNFFTQFLSNTLRGGFSLILITFFMLRLHVTIALYCFILVPVIVALSFIFQRILRNVNGEIRNRLATAIAFLAENLNGMAIVQIFHQEAKQQKKFDDRNKALLKATLHENRMHLLFFNITELLGDLGVAALVWFGGRGVIRGAISFGVLYAFIGYIRRFFQPINTITQQLNILQASIVATERIARTMQEQPEIAELPGASAPAIRGEVRFDHVSLAYRPGHTVLKDIQLTIRPGGRVGFVGASGAGKSSLMNLVARFYDATEGAVVIDGKDVREWPLEDLRRTVGIVQQDVTLFFGTILDNIRFFREEISAERVKEACRLVGAEPFILKLPQGYATVLSERGSTLSAGERQLLSFARVLVFDPKILILDEATASLDSETEEVLQEAIHRVSRGRTLLVIAHRLSTVQEMDDIIVLDHGKIVETGSHGELLQRQGYYWRLHQSGILLEEAV
ncbi:MAG: ATP-binding cassette subfamily B [Geobacteraceae bacterium]|nr:MAG: ATP-binding cassette subfamily B [Geobacteraceae bacterium]